MAFTYCRHCGFKNLYSMAEPRFCGSCGVELSSDTSASLKGEAKAEPPEPIQAPKISKQSRPVKQRSSSMESEEKTLDEILARSETKNVESIKGLRKDEVLADIDSNDYETNIDFVPKLKSLKHSVVNADFLGGRVEKLGSFFPEDEREVKDEYEESPSPLSTVRSLKDSGEAKGKARSTARSLKESEEEDKFKSTTKSLKEPEEVKEKAKENAKG